AMMIASTVGVATLFVGFVLALFAEKLEIGDLDEAETVAALALFLVPFGFATMTLLLTAMLPTPFGRAALVSFVSYAVAFLIAVVVAAALTVAWHLAGG